MYHHLESTKKKFIGKSILDISRIDESTFSIIFEDGNDLRLSVSGDCCSHSIFYDLVFPKECHGEKIIDIIEHGNNDDSEEQVMAAAEIVSPGFCNDYLRIWNVVFKTKSGNILFRHVNSSNGYYDGCTEYNYHN